MTDAKDTVGRVLLAAAALLGGDKQISYIRVPGRRAGTRERERPKLSEPTAAELRKPECLGEQGAAVLLLRHVKGGKQWHEANILEAKMEAIQWSLLSDKMDAPAFTLVGWSKQIRRQTHNADSEKGQEPVDPTQTGPCWKAWFSEPPDGLRLALDIYVEWDSLCIATILMQRTPQSPATEAAKDPFFLAVLECASELAKIVEMHYRRLWRQTQSILFNNKLMDAKLPGIDEPPRHYELYPAIATQLGNLIRQVAGALQTPFAGLFVPDFHNSVDVVGNVGYQSAGQTSASQPLRAFRFSPDYPGPTRAFCDVYATKGSYDGSINEPEQIVTGEQLVAKFSDLRVRGFDKTPEQAMRDGPPYESDRYLEPPLQALAQDEEPRGPVYGPHVYAPIALDEQVWGSLWVAPAPDAGGHSTKDTRNGLLRLQGRIPHELDGIMPPRFAQFELKWLHACAGVLGLVFQRYIRALEHKLVEELLSAAAKSIITDITNLRSASEGRPLDGLAEELKRRFDAKCVVLAHRVDDKTELLGAAPKDAQIVEDVRTDLHELEWQSTPAKERGHITTSDDQSYNRYYRAICDEGAMVSTRVLAIVGVRGEVERFPGERQDSKSDRDCGFPRLLERGIKRLTKIIESGMIATERARPPTSINIRKQKGDSKTHIDCANAWNDIIQHAKKKDAAFHEKFFLFLLNTADRANLVDYAPRVLGIPSSKVGTNVTEFLRDCESKTKANKESLEDKPILHWVDLVPKKTRPVDDKLALELQQELLEFQKAIHPS